MDDDPERDWHPNNTVDPKLAKQPAGVCYVRKCQQPEASNETRRPPRLSPLLFIIYIDDITDNIPPELMVSLFVDVVALYSSSIDLATAEARIQEALNVVAQWSTKWKLTISVGKCEASFFSTNSHESKWRPKLTIGEEEIPYSENPKFLGVTYDKQLTFTEHAKNVATSKSRALFQLAGTDWGYDKATLRSTYLAIGRTTMNYAGAAWQPWLSTTSFEKLESAQRFAGRIITGHLKTTPNECILLDTNLTSMVTQSGLRNRAGEIGRSRHGKRSSRTKTTQALSRQRGNRGQIRPRSVSDTARRRSQTVNQNSARLVNKRYWKQEIKTSHSTRTGLQPEETVSAEQG